jgi:hypothetical protein
MTTAARLFKKNRKDALQNAGASQTQNNQVSSMSSSISTMSGLGH